jgi:hypothetical protein
MILSQWKGMSRKKKVQCFGSFSNVLKNIFKNMKIILFNMILIFCFEHFDTHQCLDEKDDFQSLFHKQCIQVNKCQLKKNIFHLSKLK